MNTPAAPGATYRLQFNAEFTFADARDVVAYLHMLPISRPTPPLSSPRAGSPHGYDIVPNHMGVGGDDNAWWLDILENGEASTYATYFDIDWQSVNPALRNKVLLPFLADHYGTVLEQGELSASHREQRRERGAACKRRLAELCALRAVRPAKNPAPATPAGSLGLTLGAGRVAALQSIGIPSRHHEVIGPCREISERD